MQQPTPCMAVPPSPTGNWTNDNLNDKTENTTTFVFCLTGHFSWVTPSYCVHTVTEILFLELICGTGLPVSATCVMSLMLIRMHRSVAWASSFLMTHDHIKGHWVPWTFLPRDALVHSAILRLLSSVCPSVCNVQVPWWHRLEFF